MPCCPSAFPWTGVGMPCNRTLLLCYPCPSHHGTCMQTPSFSAVGLSHRNPTDGSNNTDYFNKTLVQQGLGSILDEVHFRAGRPLLCNNRTQPYCHPPPTPHSRFNTLTRGLAGNLASWPRDSRPRRFSAPMPPRSPPRKLLLPTTLCSAPQPTKRPHHKSGWARRLRRMRLH